MFVYIARSGHPEDKGTKRPALIAVCIPQKILGHLPGLFYRLKAEFYGQEPVEINPAEILTADNFDELTKPANRRNPEILKQLDLIDKVFHNLACNPTLRPIKIFGVVIERPDSPFQYKQPGPLPSLPSDIWFLLQRIDRCEAEAKDGQENGAILYLEGKSKEMGNPIFIQEFAQVIYNTQKQSGQFKYINPGIHKATPDLQAEPGLVLAKLVAEVVRLAHEEGLGWEGTFDNKRKWFSSICDNSLLSAIDRYYMIIAAKSYDFLENGKDKLYGLFIMKADKFVRLPDST